MLGDFVLLAASSFRLANLESVLNHLRQSLNILNDADRELAWRMIYNELWRIVASDSAMSEGYCRRRLPKILNALAVMMFGPKAM